MANITFLLFLVVVIPLLIVLEIYLFKKENKYLGLILPALLFIIITLYIVMTYFTSLSDPMEMLLPMIIAVLLYNIPSFILFMIYVIVREKGNRIKDMEKMKIKDL